MIRKQDALEYHSRGRKGKVEVVPTKPLLTARDLSLAYTPGVAEPCREIERDPDLAYSYTAKGNLVAVVSNGTATLGLGDIGALACKPVMEGKGCLFKRFADIDVFDIELNTKDPDEIINIVHKLEPTFGGINLEDIKAPECFYIEEELKKRMSIPVFHDDQHGTAIISGAGFINALLLTGKKAEEVRMVVSGAGASAIACARFYLSLGVRRENVILVDTKGVVYRGRTVGMNPYKEFFASDTDARTLAEAMVGADVFLGCSVGGLVTPEMLRTMAPNPIVFAMANPDPEIPYPEAKAARSDIIMATGRSDFPNQVNNVLGFPFIFRGALDVRATDINEQMKIAAARALAELAREDVPESVARAYGETSFRFGPEYIIPKPFDPRVLTWVAPAVARAAMESGVARLKIDLDQYRVELERIFGRKHEVMRRYHVAAKRGARRVAFPEGSEEKILRACQILTDERIARPVLLGDPATIEARIKELDLALLGRVDIVDPRTSPHFDEYVEELFQMRQRKGLTHEEARALIARRTYHAMMMLRRGHVDGVVAGLTRHYADVVRPGLEVVGLQPGRTKAAGMYMVVLKNDVKFFADATVNIDPDAATLAEVAIACADRVKELGVEPRVAMISFSNFGSSRHPQARKMALATEMVQRARPDIQVDGEMQANVALHDELRKALYPFCRLESEANVLIFPELSSANAAYKIMDRIGGAIVIGPILLGMARPLNVLQHGCSVDDIVNLTAITVVEAQGGFRSVQSLANPRETASLA